MYLSEILLDQSGRTNPYDWHRKLWQFFDLPAGASRPFQFRVEQVEAKLARVLMQSSQPVIREVAGARLNRSREFSPSFSKGQRFRFLLKANPVKTIRDDKGRRNGKGEIKSCRVPLVLEEEQTAWLTRKLAGAAEVSEVMVGARENLYFRKGNRPGKVVAVTFEGVIRVSEPMLFDQIISSGIGPAKSMGCGLLSLARA